LIKSGLQEIGGDVAEVNERLKPVLSPIRIGFVEQICRTDLSESRDFIAGERSRSRANEHRKDQCRQDDHKGNADEHFGEREATRSEMAWRRMAYGSHELFGQIGNMAMTLSDEQRSYIQPENL
jgi:hypothetical protein